MKRSTSVNTKYTDAGLKRLRKKIKAMHSAADRLENAVYDEYDRVDAELWKRMTKLKKTPKDIAKLKKLRMYRRALDRFCNPVC